MARRLQVLQGHLQQQEQEDGEGDILNVPLSSFRAGPHLVSSKSVRRARRIGWPNCRRSSC